MMTRDVHGQPWVAACEGAPPPLHVYDARSEAANWYPLPRLVLFPQHPGPTIIHIPIGCPLGDDPTDPTQQTMPRLPTAGMVGRLNPVPSAQYRAQVAAGPPL